MTVFVLENGCYSDMRIVGVYSTMEAAELAARIFKDDPSINEYELDAAVDSMRRGEVPYFVRLHRSTGDVIDAHVQDSSYGVFSTEVGVDVNRNLYTNCWASHKAEAVKIAGDRRRMFLATVELRQASDAVDPHAAK